MAQPVAVRAAAEPVAQPPQPAVISERAIAPSAEIPYTFINQSTFTAESLAPILQHYSLDSLAPEIIFNKHYFTQHFTKPPYSMNRGLVEALFASLDMFN
jgi:hypothetical protein